jgi:hypothetical protein
MTYYKIQRGTAALHYDDVDASSGYSDDIMTSHIYEKFSFYVCVDGPSDASAQ